MTKKRQFRDLTGQKIHRLTFLEFVDRNESGNARWKVRCGCGTEFTVIAGNVTHGSTRSCGCYRAELNKLRKRKYDRGTNQNNGRGIPQECGSTSQEGR